MTNATQLSNANSSINLEQIDGTSIWAAKIQRPGITLISANISYGGADCGGSSNPINGTTWSLITDDYSFTNLEKQKLAALDPSFIDLNTTLGIDNYADFEPGAWVTTPAGFNWVYFNFAGYANNGTILNVRQVAVNSIDFENNILSRTRNITINRTDPDNQVNTVTAWVMANNFTTIKK